MRVQWRESGGTIRSFVGSSGELHQALKARRSRNSLSISIAVTGPTPCTVNNLLIMLMHYVDTFIPEV